MTEEDTFKALCRSPYAVVHAVTEAYINTGSTRFIPWDEILQSHGWTRKEYQDETNRRHLQHG